MRNLVSTILVALIVGALAGATVGAVAQDGPAVVEPAKVAPAVVAPAAVSNINAHKVDGRHAVGAGASRAKRAGKLVATNKNGLLPTNIIRPAWGLIQGMPASFADGQVGWNEVKNKPAGFADGVDNIGPSYSSREIYSSRVIGGQIPAGGTRSITVRGMPRNADVHFSVVPLQSNHAMRIEYVDVWWANDGGHSYTISVGNRSPWPVHFKLRAMIFGDGIAPAALREALKTADVRILKKGK